MYSVLKKYFGYDSFRKGQKEIIDDILSGKDVLAIMPTGAGKSICFQLPAMMMSGITIVVSPLISLMKDQVDTLVQTGIPCAYINSTLSLEEMNDTLDYAMDRNLKLIYVAPERLLTESFLYFATRSTISMITIDEAHCISQWGQDFRPSYSQITKFISKLRKRPVISAFTATATKRVQDDIVDRLNMHLPTVLVSGYDRANIHFSVESPKSKGSRLIEFIKEHKKESGIVYCSTRKTVEQVCEKLISLGFSASKYHAGLSDEERHKNQDDFLFDHINIMVATNAFGMGIDKSNVSYVVHYNMPKDLESFYQEAGRCGRDGSPSHSLILYSSQDISTNRWFINNSTQTHEIDPEVLNEIRAQDHIRLKKMIHYCQCTDCLRQYILEYFGETLGDKCNYCGNCEKEYEDMDITVISQKIISCIVRMRESFGTSMVVDVLRGSKNEKIRNLELNKLSTYAICKESADTIKSVIDYLMLDEYIVQSTDQYPVLRITPKVKPLLRGEVALKMKVEKQKPKLLHSIAIKATKKIEVEDRTLFEELKSLRYSIARELSVPAFVVFSDSTLMDMANKKPTSEIEFLTVSGVGEKKLQSYGEKFISLIVSYVGE